MAKSDQIRTLNKLIETSAEKFSDRPVLSMAFQKPITYGEFLEKTRLMSKYLKHRSIAKGDKVAILAENSPNWAIAYFAIIRLGALAVPILPDFTGPDVRHIIVDAGVKILFASERQIEKIHELTGHNFTDVIVLEDKIDTNDYIKTKTFSACLADAAHIPEKKRPQKTEAGEDDLASIIYTSGTSGHSKAVMLTHKNLYSNVLSVTKLIDITPDWTFLSILPMSHTYEFTIGLLLPLISGARVVYAGKSPTPTILEKICAAEKPSAICIVPIVFEKIYKKRVVKAIKESSLLRFITKSSFLKKQIYKLIGNKLLAFFGGKLKIVAIGGAPLLREVEEFIHESGIPYLVGYGLTETSPLLAAGPFKDPTIAIGSTGKPIPEVQIKIADPNPQTGIGEILARGPNVMLGYYKHPELTAKTIDSEGWLATGDLGMIDSVGNLHITGRSKSVIVLPNGKNIYPEAIEDKINTHFYVSESLVVENNGKLEAIIYLDYDQINESTRGLINHQKLEFIAKTLKEIQKTVNSQFPAYSQISQCIERRDPFIKTATQKIKRYLYSKNTV